MIGLIRKDLYYLASSWKPLLLSVFIIGGFSTWKGFGAILIVILPTFFGLSIMGCIQMDAQNKWYDYYRVLPISFRNVVAARYFAYLAFTGIGFLITVVYGYVIQFTMGITALGTRFAMWQGFSMGIALALSFAAVFIPATYYNKGEKMEVSIRFVFAAVCNLMDCIKYHSSKACLITSTLQVIEQEPDKIHS